MEGIEELVILREIRERPGVGLFGFLESVKLLRTR
jgi:hypothetical protein